MAARISGQAFSKARAQRALRFIENLTHTKDRWAGQPFEPRIWQKTIIRELFGRMRPDQPKRRAYRTCYIEIPRKNGKSELAAAFALYGLVGDGVIGAEVYSAAADRDQATLVYNVAAQMVRNDPVLSARLRILDSQKRIIDYQTGSFYKAISAEAYSKHGFNCSMLIYDELHAAANRDLWDVLTTSMGARFEPLVIAITTAGFDRHSICWEQHAYAEKILADRSKDASFYPVIYKAPDDADWLDEKVWKACNPALEDFRDIEEMRALALKAAEIPALQNTFRRLYLNQWTEQAVRWMPMAAWQACRQEIDWRAYEKRRCFVGMDLSSTQDITALCAIFPEEDGSFAVLPAAFAPAATIRQRATRDRRPYDVWAQQGALQATPGAVVDYEAVRATLQEWSQRFSIQRLGYDPWNATDLVSRLEHQDGFECVPIRQGFASLSAPTKELTKAILGGKLRHDGHPVLADHIANAAVEQDAAGNIKLSKKASSEKIDLAMALVCGVDLLTRDIPTVKPQYQMFVFNGR